MVVVPAANFILPAEPGLPHATGGAMVCPRRSFWCNVAPGDRHGSPPENMLSPIPTIDLASVQVFLKKGRRKWMSISKLEKQKKWVSFSKPDTATPPEINVCLHLN
jgi:hypothetical protein